MILLESLVTCWHNLSRANPYKHTLWKFLPVSHGHDIERSHSYLTPFRNLDYMKSNLSVSHDLGEEKHLFCLTVFMLSGNSNHFSTQAVQCLVRKPINILKNQSVFSLNSCIIKCLEFSNELHQIESHIFWNHIKYSEHFK